jgi:pullulanase
MEQNIDNIKEGYPITNKQLGMIYTPTKTTFRVWSPIMDKIELVLYKDSKSHEKVIYPMRKSIDGVHEVTIRGDLKGLNYSYLVRGLETTDPYSIAASINSQRSGIVDLKETNPEGWENQKIPQTNKSEAIIYEAHIKDFTASASSNVNDRGKYLAFIEKIPYLKELGVTHIHLMPINDFITVNEEEEFFFHEDNYNWGYDPELYNVPEGSYSTDPEDLTCRIRELKTLIMELHNAGLSVIMDVVYNHTYKTEKSNFNIIMPDYFHRKNPDGSFSNGSGVGNEIASERPMVKKFIIDSLKYWVNEYKIDGFRFDLMALIDIDTVKEAVSILSQINPNILIYGEPWTGGPTVLPPDKMTLKGRQKDQNFSLFNDDFRNAIKGDNDGHLWGYAQGSSDLKHQVEIGLAGSINYYQNHKGFTNNPLESINYLNSHDNLILADKIKKSLAHMDEKGLIRVNKFSHSILFTAQGIPFIHAGNEFLRSKHMNQNSYNTDLSINAIDWTYKEKYKDYFNYIKDLITIRKEYEEFRMTDANEVMYRLRFMDMENIIGYTIKRKEGNRFLFISHNNKDDYIFTTDRIKHHLEKAYSINIEKMLFRSILGEGGLIRDNPEFIKADKLRIPYLSTEIYEIKIN